MLSTDQTIDIVVPIIVVIIATIGAFVLTYLYQEKSYKRNIEIDRRKKKADWIVGTQNYYMHIAMDARQLRFYIKNTMRAANTQERDNYTKLSFYYLVLLLRAFRDLEQKVGVYFFDDLPAEFFLSMMEFEFYKILDGVFTFEQQMRLRELLADGEGYPAMVDKIDRGGIAANLYGVYSNWLTNKRAIANFLEVLFVYAGTMIFELNRMLLVLYQKGTAEKLQTLMGSQEFAMLNTAIQLYTKKLKKQYGLDYVLT